MEAEPILPTYHSNRRSTTLRVSKYFYLLWWLAVLARLVQARTAGLDLIVLATGSPHAPSGSRDMKFGGSKTTEVHQERRARPWRAPGGGLDAIIKTPSPPPE